MNNKQIVQELVKIAKSIGAIGPWNFDEAEEYLYYIKHTLIPDLRSSGMRETAKDFSKLAKLIYNRKMDRSFANYLKRTLIPDLYDSGYVATAEDFEEGVHWMEEVS